MTAKDIFNGSTGNRATILILDDATSKPKTGVAFNAAGLSISYRIGTGSAVAITLTSGNWFEVGGGKYYVDVADSVYAVGNLGSLVQFYGALTDSSVYAEQHRVVAYNPLLAALGANTTTPPTAAANADAVWDEPYNQHTTAGTFGKLMDILRKSNTVIEGTILASPTPTTTTFKISGADYPTGALEHSVLWMSSGTSAEQNSPILTTVNNGDGTLTITLEEALVTAPIAGDVVLIDPTSHVHAIVDIVTAVWSALTSGLSVVGSTGRALARLIGLVVDDGGDEFTAKSLSNAPAGGVQVLPAIGVAAGRGDRTTLVAYVAETITTSITVYQADGTTAYNLSGKTLAVIFENPKTGDDVAVVASGSITISGTDSNVVTFAYPSAATSAQRELTWTMRDASAPKTVYLRGVLEVRAAATVD
jgi:hypothetical protein